MIKSHFKIEKLIVKKWRLLPTLKYRSIGPDLASFFIRNCCQIFGKENKKLKQKIKAKQKEEHTKPKRKKKFKTHKKNNLLIETTYLINFVTKPIRMRNSV